MSAPITQAPILVTGASGFIATHIVEQLLAQGYTVRGTVRDASDLSKYDYLTKLPGAKARLELVSAQLLDEGAFDALAEGCEYIMHTASPYVIDVKDPQRDLVEPAVQGTLNVMNAAAKNPTVKRVILTSSMAAITDEPDSDHTLTEADWNERSSLTRNPYYYSKTLAERAGWEFLERYRPSFDLVVINPFMVIGPSHSHALNPSNAVLRDIAKGVYPGIMSLTWGFVDVRDVAKAHIAAMLTPHAQGRYVCANTTMSMAKLVALLRDHDQEKRYKLPRLNMAFGAGDAMVKLMSYTQPKGVGSYLRTHVGRVPRFSHAKAQAELGLDFMPLEQSILETMQDLQRWGHI